MSNPSNGDNTPQASDNDRLSFQQLCEMARHYGNMRFAMYAVFMGVTGALLAVEMGQIGKIPIGLPINLFRIGAIIIVTCFGVAEYRVGKLVVAYQEKASSIYKEKGLTLPTPDGHDCWKDIVRFIMLVPLLLALGLWVFCLFWSCGKLIGQ